MKFILSNITLFTLSLITGCSNSYSEKDEKVNIVLDQLMKSDIGLNDSLEILMSTVEISSNFTLPKHYHPGEEFGYMLEGNGTLIVNNTTKTFLKEGDAFRIPFQQIHTFVTKDENAKVVVFRVHPKGRPVKIGVDEAKVY